MGMSSGFSAASSGPSIMDAATKAAGIAQQDQLQAQQAQAQQSLTPIKKDSATRLYGRGNTMTPITPVATPVLGKTTLGV